MILTDEKYTVTLDMMKKNNMFRYMNGEPYYGIPIDLDNLELGLKWKSFGEIGDEDFDQLEQYFLAKNQL